MLVPLEMVIFHSYASLPDGNLVEVYLPLWKMMEWKSVGMMKFPTEWKNETHVPNHQPE